MRIVVKNGFSNDLAGLLLEDLGKHVKFFETHPQKAPGPAERRKRQSFAH
jgi:hypothetical protein